MAAEAELDLGTYGYAGQYRQKPVPPGGGMFKTDMLNYANPSAAKFTRIVRYWDKAGTRGGGCFTVGFKMGVEMRQSMHGKRPHFWILDIVRGQWEAYSREQKIRATAEMDGRECTQWVEQAPGEAGKESAQATIANLAGYKCKPDKVTGDKEDRADPFATQMNGGNVTISTNISPAVVRAFIEEARFFPHSTYKDQIDAGSGACAKCWSRRTKAGRL